jgi:serralysin
MLRRTLGLTGAVLMAMAMTTSLAGSTFASGGSPARSTKINAGPECPFTTELTVTGVEPLKNQAVIDRTSCGYRFRAGQQNSHLTITVVSGGLLFADTGTAAWKTLARKCTAQHHVKKGVAAICKVPKKYSNYNPLLIEIWPRLGNDYVDASTLPAMFSEAFLSDKGNDVGHLGAGADYFNGGPGRDKVWGGAGNDWLRTGDDGDQIWGGDGNDYLVGTNGADDINGGAGADQIFCGSGPDKAITDSADTITRLCEQIDQQ